MSFNWIDWFGHTASVVILVSLTMRSIVKLRWINMVGGAMFSAFGFMIGSMPVALLNLGIVFIDMYYLYRLYNDKDEFAVVEAEVTSKYFHHFLTKNSEGIAEYFQIPEFEENQKAYYFLRNNNTAGILIGRSITSKVFFIDVDYVTEKYRDFKIGMHFLGESRISKILKGYEELQTKAKTPAHAKYLEKIGFKKLADKDVYVKTI